MKVILVQTVNKVGKKGEIVEVSDGYANNFLLKRNLAVMYNKESINALNKTKEEEKQKDLQARELANNSKESLKNLVVKFNRSVGSENRLHNAITAKNIEEELAKQHGIAVDKKNFKNFMPIKVAGKFVVEIILYKDIVGKINVEIIGE